MASYDTPRPSPDEILAARQRAGISQGEMAKQVGVNSYKSVGGWENGARVSDKHLVKLTAWMRKHGWDPSKTGEKAPEQGKALAVRDAAAGQVPEDPAQLLSALVGRVQEIRLFQRFADERMASILETYQRFALKLPEDVAAEQQARREATGSDR